MIIVAVVTITKAQRKILFLISKNSDTSEMAVTGFVMNLVKLAINRKPDRQRTNKMKFAILFLSLLAGVYLFFGFVSQAMLEGCTVNCDKLKSVGAVSIGGWLVITILVTTLMSLAIFKKMENKNKGKQDGAE